MKKFLIVDDIRENLYLLESLLKGYGYEVETVYNGVEALKILETSLPDMIISDILMPEMDGFAFCRKCKESKKTKKIPFLFYTATYTGESDKKFALSLGADRFLIKPVEPVDFIKIVEEVFKEQNEKKPRIINIHRPVKEVDYLKKHNKALIDKLEKKVDSLEKLNKKLDRENTERKKLEKNLHDITEGLEEIVADRTEGLSARVRELMWKIEELEKKVK